MSQKSRERECQRRPNLQQVAPPVAPKAEEPKKEGDPKPEEKKVPMTVRPIRTIVKLVADEIPPNGPCSCGANRSDGRPMKYKKCHGRFDF